MPEYPAEPITAEDYANFTQWIPRYKKPARSCEYCRSLHLECFFTFENQRACSACNALFRPCSFVVASQNNAVMDTLHTVEEYAIAEQGAMTGVKALRSFDRHGAEQEDDDYSSRKTGTRFSKETIKTLKKWLVLQPVILKVDTNGLSLGWISIVIIHIQLRRRKTS